MNAGDHIYGNDVLASIFAKEKEADVYYGEANFVKENREPHWYPF